MTPFLTPLPWYVMIGLKPLDFTQSFFIFPEYVHTQAFVSAWSDNYEPSDLRIYVLAEAPVPNKVFGNIFFVLLGQAFSLP